MQLNEFYKVMDWPAVPDEICDELIDFVETTQMESIWESHFPETRYFQYPVIGSAIDWIKQNLPIPDDYTIRIQKATERGLHIHKDFLRSFAYNFVMTDDQSVTSWYDDLGTNGKPNYHLIESVQYKSRVWYQHQSQRFHDVTRCKGTRIAITIFKFEMQHRDWNKSFNGDRTDPKQVVKFLEECGKNSVHTKR